MDHAVFATLADMTVVRVSDPETYPAAVARWKTLDDLRRSRRFPTVRHFEVRSLYDPRYADAPVRVIDPLDAPSRGYRNVEDASRRAWRAWQGDTTPYGTTQGADGWFYWHNGRTAAQGLRGLARLCRSRGLVALGVDGRWHSTVTTL